MSLSVRIPRPKQSQLVAYRLETLYCGRRFSVIDVAIAFGPHQMGNMMTQGANAPRSGLVLVGFAALQLGECGRLFGVQTRRYNEGLSLAIEKGIECRSTGGPSFKPFGTNSRFC